MRGAAFSGGGSKGQFHVGAMRWALLEANRRYDAYAGVSVGALVSGLLAQYGKDEAEAAYLCLSGVFTDIQDRDIWKRWRPFGKLHGLWRSAFLNSQPLHKRVGGAFCPELVRTSGTLLRIGAVSVRTGEYKMFTEESEHIDQAILASSAFPAMFLPVEVDGELFTDGGVREITPIKALIDAGCNEIDVFICHPRRPITLTEKNPEALDMAARAIDLMGHELIWRDLKMAQTYNKLPGKKVVKFNVVYPDFQLNDDSLSFSRKETEFMQGVGYDAARKVLR